MMKVGVIGSNGQLGSAIRSELWARGYEVAPLNRPDYDVENSLWDLPRGTDVVINTAAFHDLRKCEEDPEQAFVVNAVGALNVAKAASRVGAFNIYISTDYVFSNKGYYREWDSPQPQSVYAASKSAGEALTHAYFHKAAVVRFGSLFGGIPRGKGPSFVDRILQQLQDGEKFSVVSDEYVSPAYTKDVARNIVTLCEKPRAGTYHFSNQGRVSYYEFAQEIAQQAGLPVTFVGCSSQDPLRPADCSTISSGLRRPWQEALHDYLVERGYANA